MLASPAIQRFSIEPRGRYSLAASAEFVGGFVPDPHRGADEAGHLHMAFCVEGTWEPAGVCLTEAAGAVHGAVYGAADPGLVRAQVARILSLDLDGTVYDAIGQRDPSIGALQRRFGFLRPVLSWSVYEGLVRRLMSQRISMRQAGRIKERMARELGPKMDIHGDVLDVFPSPAVLRELGPVQGLNERKVEWIRAAAAAALDGRLDAVRLRAMDGDAAVAELRQLPGVGPMTAEGTLIRGAGAPDRLALMEPRLPRAVQHAYGLADVPADDEIVRISDGWRPFRSWVTVLVRMAYGRERPDDAARLDRRERERTGRRPRIA